MNKKYYVRILPKAEVLDVQGRAVTQMLLSQNHPVASVRVGKLIEIVLSENGADAKAVLKKIASEGLYNPLVEVAELEGL